MLTTVVSTMYSLDNVRTIIYWARKDYITLKRWKITAKRCYALTVFLTEEALYMWLVDGAHVGDICGPKYKGNVETLTLNKGDELIVEWLGSEYVTDDASKITFTLKAVKLTSVRGLRGSWIPAFIDCTTAWISDEILSLSDVFPCTQGLQVVKVDNNDPDPIAAAINMLAYGDDSVVSTPDQSIDAHDVVAKIE